MPLQIVLIAVLNKKNVPSFRRNKRFTLNVVSIPNLHFKPLIIMSKHTSVLLCFYVLPVEEKKCFFFLFKRTIT